MVIIVGQMVSKSVIVPFEFPSEVSLTLRAFVGLDVVPIGPPIKRCRQRLIDRLPSKD